MESTPTALPDTPCSRCGYNLKGLDPASNCPECGQPIPQTLTFGLEHADRAWLRRQSTTVLLLVALPLLDYQSPLRADWPYGSYYVGVAFRIIITAVTVWACWRLSVPDPVRQHTDPHGTISRGLRVAAFVQAAALIVFFRSPLWEFVGDNLWLLALYVWAGALFLTGWLAMLLVLDIVRRGDSPALAKHARLAVWALPLSKLSVVVLPMIATPLSPEAAMAVLTVCSWGVSVVTLITAALLGRVHEFLSRAAALPQSH